MPAAWSAWQYVRADSIGSRTCLHYGMPLSMSFTLDMTPCMWSGSFLAL